MYNNPTCIYCLSLRNFCTVKRQSSLFLRKLVTFQKLCIKFSFRTSFLSICYETENIHSNDMPYIFCYIPKKWEMEIDNPQLLPRTKGILVYGIYAHFLWLCHYTHTFVIDNPIFTKNVCFQRRRSDS